MHDRQLSYCSVKLGSSLVQTYGRPIAPILIPLIIVYGMLCRIVCQTPIQDMADLRQCWVDTWSSFSHSIVDNAIDEWCKTWGLSGRRRRPLWTLAVILGLYCAEQLDTFSFVKVTIAQFIYFQRYSGNSM